MSFDSTPDPVPPRRAVAMSVTAILIALVLGFAAVAKFTGPNPAKVLLGPEVVKLHEKGLLLDHVIACVEVVVIVGLLVFHRRRWAWVLTALMFAGFCGYTLAYLIRGEPCGCFGKLWTPPHGLTFGLDVVFATASLALTGLRGRRMAALAAGMVACMATGFLYAKLTAPPTSTQARQEEIERTGVTPEQQLLESPMLADVFADKTSHITYYIFIYDPDCNHCQAMKPVVEQQKTELEEFEDPVLRVRVVSVPDIHAQLGIATWVWTPTPTALFIRDGQFLLDEKDEPRRFKGEGVPFPKDKAVYDKYFEELNAILQSGR